MDGAVAGFDEVVVGGGRVQPLTASYTAGRARKARAVDEINAALAERG